jgi:signal peptidase II
MDTRRRLVYATTAVVAVAWVVLDQATKMVAVRTWSEQPPTDLGPVVLRLIYNDGGAFSLPIRLPWVFIAVTVVVCALVLRALPETRSLGVATAYGLVVGGAIGNGADRIFRGGAVVDMIDLDFPPLQGFPVFNVADIGITIGAAMVALLMVLHDRREQASRKSAVLDDEADRRPPEAAPPAGAASREGAGRADGADGADGSDDPAGELAGVHEGPADGAGRASS